MTRKDTVEQTPTSNDEPNMVGAIDMGSKNFKCVFGHKFNRSITTELIRKDQLEIGKEVTNNDGIIGQNKIKQIEATLFQFVQYCRKRGASTVLAIATSAIRNAKNHQQIIDLARDMGLTIEIADGVREGEIGYLAATGGLPNKLVSDSGSKSIQIAWEVNGNILSRSVPVGYEMAYESFVEHASTIEETKQIFSKFLDGNFKGLPENTDQFIALAANTITSFVVGEERTGQQTRTLTRIALNNKILELMKLSSAQYNNLKSSISAAEKILPGLIFIDYLMERTGHTEALIADVELPAGLIVEYFLKSGSIGT